ncbi:MAG: DUF1800 domain-containing protein [Paracoccaceae bacterium]
MTNDRHALSAIRFGMGLPAPEGSTTPEAMVAALAGPDIAAQIWPGVTMAEVMPVYRTAAQVRRDVRRDEGLRPAYRDATQATQEQQMRGFLVQVARGVGSESGFRERLVQFWADHFTTEARFRHDVGLTPAMVEECIRPHVGGRFGDMLAAVTLQPAMLLYLDQVQSVGPGSPEGQRRGAGLNENLARELLELHTLGVGSAYRQDDVRQAANLLTGLTADAEQGFFFNPRIAEPGAETVLGQSYDGEGVQPVLDLLGDLALHPDTAQHLARKLVVHFISDTPDAGQVADMAAAYLGGDGALGPVYAAMFAHPAAFSPVAMKARQPFDFMIASLRALQTTTQKILEQGRGAVRRRMLTPLQRMGQPLGASGGPDGWEEAGAAWITPQGMAARITWAMEMPSQFASLPDPRDFLQTALGNRASERLIWAVGASQDQREGVGLILASPEFNRR